MTESSKHPKHYASKFKGYLSINQLIPSAINTVAILDTRDFDTLNEFNTATYTFTPVESGYYYLHGHAVFSLLVPIGTHLNLMVNIVGVGAVDETKTAIGVIQNSMDVSTVHYLTPADIVSLVVWHNAVGNQTLQSGLLATFLEGFRVG